MEDTHMRVLLMLLAVAAMAVIPVAAAQQAKSPAPASKSAATSKAAPAPASINLNTATQAQLEALPGVGPKAAQAILDYRKQNGNFKKIEDLMNVKGFGEKTFLKLKPMLTVGDKDKAGTN
jgi:competence protein ComEA